MEQQGKELVKTVEEIIADVMQYDEAAKVNTNSLPGLSRVSSREIILFWGAGNRWNVSTTQLSQQSPATVAYIWLLMSSHPRITPRSHVRRWGGCLREGAVRMSVRMFCSKIV